MRRSLLFIVFLSAWAHAQTSIPQVEINFQHPTIFRFDNREASRQRFTQSSFSFRGEEWDQTKIAMVRFLVTLEFYPENYEFYFLARDAEPLYDLARLLFRGEASMKRRLHLLKVSRASKSEPGLWNYLAQEGINEEEASAGKKFLLIDTGTRGTIPDFLRAMAGSEISSRIQAHFLLSGNSAYPSSRSFLSTLEPSALTFELSRHESHILVFENLPHYTYPAVRYQKIGNRWGVVTGPTFEAPSALSPFGFENGNGLLPESSFRDRLGAEALQFDLYKFSQSNSARSELESGRKIWSDLRSVYLQCERDSDLLPFQKALAELLLRSRRGTFEAIARDALEMVNKNFIRTTKARIKWADVVRLSHCEGGLIH